jgi:hypothetical protein
VKIWLALAAAAALAVLAATPVLAAGGAVSGVITNWYQVKDRVAAKAYFQLVKKEEKLAANTDQEGLGAIKSELPRVAVRSSGGFQISVAGLPPGAYFIALQRGFASAPIVVKDGKPVMIKVPGQFPLNVGSVKLEMPLGHGTARQHMEVVK